MLVLFGKSGTGKDTLANILKSKYGFSAIQQVTTRDIRPGENATRPYLFVSESGFYNLYKAGSFITFRSFKHLVNDKIRRDYYGIPWEAVELAYNTPNSILLTDIDTAKALKKKLARTIFENNTHYIELVCADDIRTDRQLQRGAQLNEVTRRLKDETKRYKQSDKLREACVDTSSIDIDTAADMLYNTYTNLLHKEN